MELPAGLTCLIDVDVLRYEVGFGAETYWKSATNDPEATPPFHIVENLLLSRIDEILRACNTDKYELYHTQGRTFRDEIATVKPYKGNRIAHKPWHYDNLTVYLELCLGSNVVTGIEADDAISIRHTNTDDTIICSRDKDLRQCPGWFYSWELGAQPSFGPEYIDRAGYLEPVDKNKLRGTGLAFFYAQCLMGDSVDNIPGLPGCGPVAAYNILSNPSRSWSESVQLSYRERYGDSWGDKLREQGRLLWMTRKLNEDGSPVLWEIGMEE